MTKIKKRKIKYHEKIKNPYLILKTCLRDVSRRGGLLIEVYKRNFMKNLMLKLIFFYNAISFLYWNQLTKFKENKKDDTKKEGFNA